MNAVLPPAHTLRILAQTLHEAENDGKEPVCLAIYDAFGILAYFVRMQGAPQRTVEIAAAKARTAALMETSTRAVGERLRHDQVTREDFCGAVTTCLPGGVPLQKHGLHWGAVGVSGRKTADDEELALRCVALLLQEL